MSEKNVNVEVDADLWQRVKALAVSTNRPLKAVVANALRLVVADRTGSVGGVTGGQPPAAERGASTDPMLAVAGRQPSVADLARLVAGKPGAAAGVDLSPREAERGVLGPCEGCGANARLQFTSDDVGLCAECFAAVPVTGPRETRQRQTTALDAAGAKPTKDQLQALIDGVQARVDRVSSGTVVERVVSQTVSPEGVTGTVFVGTNEAERRRRAAQDRLRTHPEDDSQVRDDDKAGF